jgi:hypothetical protein
MLKDIAGKRRTREPKYIDCRAQFHYRVGLAQ